MDTKKNTALWSLYVFFIFCVLGLSAWVYSQKNFFRLSSIEITSEDEALKSDLFLSLSSRLGQNLYSMSLEECADDLSKNPWVHSVSVRKKWPSSLWVHVHKKKVAFTLKQKDKFFLVDSFGERILRVQAKNEIVYPVVQDSKLGLSKDRLKSIANWLLTDFKKSSLHKTFGDIQLIQWLDLHGWHVQFKRKSTELVLGLDDIVFAQKRVEHALLFKSEEIKRARKIDASQNRRLLLSF